ncbi:MAG: hypothetical protein IJU51_06680 [Clostridia bacterium]|nr:hypothetical protein [Clostridia bacterium]
MGYIYSVLWFLMSAMLVGKFRRESAAIYVLSVYFVYLGFWWLADELVPSDMLAGSYGWILRIVSAVALIVTVIVYYVDKSMKEKKSAAEAQETHATADGQ